MKDLYSRLELDKGAHDADAIRSAIAACMDEESAESARQILLVPERKRIYDRYHGLLQTLSQLRTELSIDTTEHWANLCGEDFAPQTAFDLVDWAADFGVNEANTPTPARIRRRFHSDLNIQKILLVAAGTLLVGVIIITVSTRLMYHSAVMPMHGHVQMQSTIDTPCKVWIHNPGPGNATLDICDGSGRSLLTILVCEGLRTRAAVPEGEFTIRYTVGEATDWDGERFRKGSLSRTLPPHTMRFEKGRFTKILIPTPSSD